MTVGEDGGAQAALREEAEALYARYIACWNGRDLDGVADCFDVPVTFLNAAGARTAADRAAVIARFEGVFPRLDAEGFHVTEAPVPQVRAFGEGLAQIDAQGIRRLRADGSLIETVDARYMIRLTEAGWRIVVSMTCPAA